MSQILEERIEKLKLKVADFPQTAGVYIMKNSQQKVIYVGKAIRLRNRVRSYLNSNVEDHKTQILVRHIESIDYILTHTEAEAFLLEASLIKKHRPRYNIRLKDDKAYPYLRLSLKDPFPRLYLSRKVAHDGSLYFGPYTSGFVVREIMRFLNHSFKIRDCTDHFMKSRKRPCMTYQIGACTAPCVNFITSEDYRKDIFKAKRFLEKETTTVIVKLKKQMLDLADEEKFELAARFRDSINAIERVLEKQAVINAKATNNQDVIGFFGDDRGTLIQTLHIRQGRVIGQRHQFFSQIDCSSAKEDIREWLPSFLIQYYDENIVPDEIFLPVDLGFDLVKLLEDVFKHRGHTQTRVVFPTHSLGQKLIQMATQNAQSHFDSQVSKSEKRKLGLEIIAQKFKLKNPPYRIECYDISHFQGEESVGSQVVCENGVLNRDHYRRYKIKSKTRGDDYAALSEVLGRRLSHDEWEAPDLIVIDGGKGQLNAAHKVLKDLGRDSIPIVGLAKERTKRNFQGEQVEKTAERFYLPNRANPVTFAEGSEAFKILVSLRDEAHRFAISFHRKLRDEKSFSSQLNNVKGLGPTLVKRLLTHFDSLESMKEASVEELCEVNGMNKALANVLLTALSQPPESE